MSVEKHLGIRVRDYDTRIRTFIPHYEDMLDAAAAAVKPIGRRAPLLLDLGVGSGELAARCLSVLPRAQIIGIDTDEGMLALARRRLGARLAARHGDFLSAPLPRCDVVMASLALHHVRTRRRKALLYARCFAALRPGGLLVNADRCLASDRRLQALDRDAWRAHLQRRYGRSRAERFLRGWAKEDVYIRLEDELDLLRRAGFAIDVPWRRDGFAIVVGAKARHPKALSLGP
jgi:tRNA (cmo5U34)-methyltransferase